MVDLANYDPDHVGNPDNNIFGLPTNEDDARLIILGFSNSLELSIDMSEDGYLGPEAIQLTRPGLPSVVWRPDD